jgi:hypothetical protein
MALFLLENRDFLGFRMIFKVWLNQIFSNFNTMLWTLGHNSGTINVKYTVIELNLYLIVHSIVLKFEMIWLSHTLNISFRMIFKVWLNYIISIFNTMLWTIKYRLSLITVYFTFIVPELWPFFS